MRVLAAALLLAAAPAPATLSGDYETHQMEMAGGLRLAPNGRFLYAFDYGAVSEMAQGTWSGERGFVRLTSQGRPPGADPERSWAKFRGQRLGVDGTSLVMQRYDTIIRFERVAQ